MLGVSGRRWAILGFLSVAFLVLGFVLGSYKDSVFRHVIPFSSGSSHDISQISFAEVADLVTPSVVSVVSTKIVDFNPINEGTESWPQGQPEGEGKRKTLGYGSGFVIDGRGLILTNDHVVDDARHVTVRLSNGIECVGKLLGSDRDTDLALLKINYKDRLVPARLGDSDRLRVGDWVMAVGNPYNYDHTVTVGVVSAKDRKIDDNPFESYIQTDAAINYGNSGGPLFNSRGEVVAINCAISTKGRGIGFSIPINVAKDIVRQLEEKGRVVRGFLGLGPDTISEDYARLLHLPTRQGILVVEVEPDSAAARAGIRRYDAITEMDGQPIMNKDDFFRRIAGSAPGTRLSLRGLRDQKEIVFTVVVRERQPLKGSKLLPEENDSEQLPETPASAGDLGVAVQELTEEHRKLLRLDRQVGGVVIVNVAPISPAADAGLSPGDIVLEINRHSVRSLPEYQRLIAQSKEEGVILLLISRPRNYTRLITVKLDNLAQ